LTLCQTFFQFSQYCYFESQVGSPPAAGLWSKAAADPPSLEQL